MRTPPQFRVGKEAPLAVDSSRQAFPLIGANDQSHTGLEIDKTSTSYGPMFKATLIDTRTGHPIPSNDHGLVEGRLSKRSAAVTTVRRYVVAAPNGEPHLDRSRE